MYSSCCTYKVGRSEDRYNPSEERETVEDIRILFKCFVSEERALNLFNSLNPLNVSIADFFNDNILLQIVFFLNRIPLLLLGNDQQSCDRPQRNPLCDTRCLSWVGAKHSNSASANQKSDFRRAVLPPSTIATVNVNVG